VRRASIAGALVPPLVVLLMGLVPVPAGGQEVVTPADCDRAVQETIGAYRKGRRSDPGTEQLARDCSTPVRSETIVSEGDPSSDGAVTRTSVGSGCRTIRDGRAYYNGFGQEIIFFLGTLRWCFNRGWTTGGSFDLDVRSCCFWYFEGVVHSENRGCWGGCTFVSRYRLGSFIFNPPWPTITTRVQPWFRLRGNGDGTAVHSSGA
jgi:hypothetical protein